MAVTPEPVAAVNTICRISILHPLKKLQFLGQFRLGFVQVKSPTWFRAAPHSDAASVKDRHPASRIRSPVGPAGGLTLRLLHQFC